MSDKSDKTILKKLFEFGLVSWLMLFLIWIAASLVNGEDFLPSPRSTFLGLVEMASKGLLMTDIGISLKRVLIGWVRGLVIAIPTGLMVGRFNPIRTLLEPLINFFRFIPAIGFLTLFLMWFGVGEESKTALITYATVFPVIINTAAGVAGIDRIKYQAAESLGASKVQTFFTVTVPGAVPNIFTGMRLGLSGAITSIVAAEMLAANEGIGYRIYTSRLYYRTDWIFVGIFILGFLGFLADKLLRRLAYRFFKYYGVSGE